MTTEQRDMIFISHATPEDNEFARWVTLRLAADGYPVWCDLTKLLGGEHFWEDAERAIRERTVKFLYVLSKVSNVKEGPRNELQVAKNVARAAKLKNFIVPLHVDDLSYGSVNVLLTSINAIPFERGWAEGYARLLEVLERDGVEKNLARFNPATVSTWWKDQFNTERTVKPTPEFYQSNWFPIIRLPIKLHFHTLKQSKQGLVQPDPMTLPYPGFMDGIDLVTFADSSVLDGKLGESVSIAGSVSIPIQEIIDGSDRANQMTNKMGRQWLNRLLVENWNWWMRDPLLLSFRFADSGLGFFFRKQDGDELELPFIDFEGKTRRRSVVGYSTQQNKSKRYWHFGIKARSMLQPYPMLNFSSHVVFSDDGRNFWDDSNAMHRARRRQCKNWHNPEWRDRLLAMLNWLGDGDDVVRVQVSSDDFFELSLRSAAFLSDVSFADPLTLKERRELQRLDLPIEDDDEQESEEEDDDEGEGE